jgi:hypothetical protein
LIAFAVAFGANRSTQDMPIRQISAFGEYDAGGAGPVDVTSVSGTERRRAGKVPCIPCYYWDYGRFSSISFRKYRYIFASNFVKTSIFRK